MGTRKLHNKREDESGTQVNRRKLYSNNVFNFMFRAAEWKTNVPELNERRRAKQLPSSSTNRRNGNKRPDSNSGKPVAGFQHDDRFNEKSEDKEKTPDENRTPQVS
jgi:hypothetical protein